MNDDAIREDMLHELNWDPTITSSDIAVTVKEAMVALSGFVPNYWEKLEAERAVKRVRGVRGVANDINVALSSKRTGPEVAMRPIACSLSSTPARRRISSVRFSHSSESMPSSSRGLAPRLSHFSALRGNQPSDVKASAVFSGRFR